MLRVRVASALVIALFVLVGGLPLPTVASAARLPTTASPFILPVGPDETTTVTQGNNMPITPPGYWDHLPGTKGAWAIDFIADTRNFPVVAAQGGTVIGLQGDSDIQCSKADVEDSPQNKPLPGCWTQANFVLIADDDGKTAALYMHLKQNSIAVQRNQHVDQGTQLALAGSTGWSTGVHLHFQVEAVPSSAAQSQQNPGWWWTQSQRMTFANPAVLAQDANGVPLTGQSFQVAALGVAPTSTPTPAPTATATIAQVPAGTVTPYLLTTPNSQPNAIVAYGGYLWVTQSRGGKVDNNPSGGCSCVGSIARITTNGSISVFADPTLHNTGDGDLQPEGITPGPNGNVWFAMSDQFGIGYIGQITTDGNFSELPTYTTDGNVQINSAAAIAAGRDGDLWFTYQGGVGRIDPSSGQITMFTITDIQLGGITAGPDGNLWFTDENGIERISPDGTMREFPLDPSAIPAAAGITVGPDGALWFAEQNGIGRITTGGNVTSYPLKPNSYPDSITLGPDKNLWFTEAHGIGRITTSGMVTVYPVSSSFTTVDQNGQLLSAAHEGITAGPDGNLWFIDPAANSIWTITP